MNREEVNAVKIMREATNCVYDMTQALQMIANGYVYRGAEQKEIGAEEMRVIALKALGLR